MTPANFDTWQRTQWQAGENLLQMLPILAIAGRMRPLRLFTRACCALVRDRITDPWSLAAVAFAERHAESGVAGRRGRPAVAAAAATAAYENGIYRQLTHENPIRLEEGVALIGCQIAEAQVERDELTAAVTTAEGVARLRYLEWAAANGHWPPDWHLPVIRDAHRAEQLALVALLRDVAGDPFDPVACDPSWRTSTVLALAAGIYADRAFDRLPILADALQDAGCDHPDLLAHCRGPGPHVRGCWAVDLVLGKS